MLTKEEIRKILISHKDDLRNMYGVKEIGIFGSYIRGEQKETSDIDMLIEFERPISLLKMVSLENYLSDLLGLKVDIVPKEDVRPELKDEILAEAVYL
jgi:predicted nucleotidyltransferase